MSNGFTTARSAIFTVVEHLKTQAHDLLFEIDTFVVGTKNTAFKAADKLAGTVITVAVDFVGGAIEFTFNVLRAALVVVLGDDDPA